MSSCTEGDTERKKNDNCTYSIKIYVSSCVMQIYIYSIRLGTIFWVVIIIDVNQINVVGLYTTYETSNIPIIVCKWKIIQNNQ